VRTLSIEPFIIKTVSEHAQEEVPG
jgi:hypothetical protein